MKYTILPKSLFILIDNVPYTVNKEDFKYSLVLELIQNKEEDMEEYLKILNIKEYFSRFYPHITIDKDKILYKGKVYFESKSAEIILRDFLYNRLDLNFLFDCLESADYLKHYALKQTFEAILVDNQFKIPFNFTDTEKCYLITSNVEYGKLMRDTNANPVFALKIIYVPNLKNFQLKKFLSLKQYFSYLAGEHNSPLFDKIVNMSLNNNLLFSSLLYYGKFFKDCFELENTFNYLTLVSIFDSDIFRASYIYQKKQTKVVHQGQVIVRETPIHSLKPTYDELRTWTGEDPELQFDMSGYSDFFNRLKTDGYSASELMFLWIHNYDFGSIQAIKHRYNENIKNDNLEANKILIGKLLENSIYHVD